MAVQKKLKAKRIETGKAKLIETAKPKRTTVKGGAAAGVVLLKNVLTN